MKDSPIGKHSSCRCHKESRLTAVILNIRQHHYVRMAAPVLMFVRTFPIGFAAPVSGMMLVSPRNVYVSVNLLARKIIEKQYDLTVSAAGAGMDTETYV